MNNSSFPQTLTEKKLLGEQTPSFGVRKKNKVRSQIEPLNVVPFIFTLRKAIFSVNSFRRKLQHRIIESLNHRIKE